MSIILYGSSDDLIELEGDIQEEFTLAAVEDDDTMIVGFSNGILVRIRYTSEGVWRITPIVGDVSIVQAPEGDEENYTDRATIEGNIEWAVCAGQHARRKE